MSTDPRGAARLLRPIAHLARVALLAAVLVAPAAQAADANDFPARPLRLVSPFAAGGNTDMIGRMIAPRLTERFGQNVIVENRPGAGGMIGASHVAKATPDGHTMLFISGAFTAHSAVTRNLPYDPVRDFAWITSVVGYPFVVVVKADSPVATVPDLIRLAKEHPGKLNYGSVGTGSVFHLAAELIDSMAGTQMVHIPYKGSAEPLAQLMGGRLDVVFSTLTGVFPHIEAKRLRPLAVTALEPSPRLPGVPTMAETLAGYEVTSFAGIAAPRGTPRPIVMRLNREIRAVLGEPEIAGRLVAQGGEVQPSSPEAMTRRVATDIAKWRKIVAERGIEVQ
jgi:tripartite-type tricarboxylate transporter receptor subunit TctC